MRTEREENCIKIVRAALKDVLSIDSTKTEWQYEGHDLTATGLTGQGIIEVKERCLNYPEFINYLNEGLIIEKKKYDELMANSGIYLNYFDFKFCQVILIWDARRIDKSTLKKKWCKKTTEFKNNEYEQKDVYYTFLENTNIRLINCSGEWEKMGRTDLLNKLNNIMIENN
jgi:hypothetical protein